MKKGKTLFQVVIAIILGIVAGAVIKSHDNIATRHVFYILNLGGELFIRALSLIVVPLVTSSIISGIAKLGSQKSFGRIGLKTFTFYIGTSFLATLIGLVIVTTFQPGVNSSISHELTKSEHAHIKSIESTLSGNIGASIQKLFLDLVPPNIIEALAQGDMLGLIFFSIIFGFAISLSSSSESKGLQTLFRGVFKTMIEFTHIIMKALPIGVFALVTKQFAESGIDALIPLGYFTVCVFVALVIYAGVALPLMLRFIANVSPMRHFKAMSQALLTAFSTSSSSATLPLTMECVEEKAGVSTEIASIVVPLGSSINMAGSALYECVAAIFIAQVYGLDISFATQLIVLFLALLTSIGVAGVPSASLVVIIVILKALGLPTTAVGIIVAIDRILDMCRTTVNVLSDSCCAVLVAATEGEAVLQKDPEID